MADPNERERALERRDGFAAGYEAGQKAARWGTHYDSIPHGNCYDPVHCDCECAGCAPVKAR